MGTTQSFGERVEQIKRRESGFSVEGEKRREKMRVLSWVVFLTLCFCPGVSFGDCVEGDCSNGQGVLVYPSGDKYVGQFRDGKMEGQGTLMSSDGAKYVGAFKNNMLNGQGVLVRPNGVKYVGEFKNNKIHGKGTLTSPEGKELAGRFRDGEFIGK